MEQIAIIFFALASFFGVEGNHIAADKTTVTVSPQNQRIDITQQDLFAIIRSDVDIPLVQQQWTSIYTQSRHDTGWAKALTPFATKTLNLAAIDDNIQPQLTLTYSAEKDLRVMGIWYNAEKNQFSVNHVPRDNLQTTDGKLIGNYWVFDGDQPFSFTLEPFQALPEQYQKLKRPLSELLMDSQFLIDSQ